MPPTGTLKKMQTKWVDPTTPIAYELRLNNISVPLNDRVGNKVKLIFTGKINCIACGRDIKKTFQQGYCFPCTQKLAETDLCIVKPELCHYHLGTCRDDAFAHKQCFIPHVVYLAVSSGAKVGITRAFQKFTRWADQGAAAAIDFAEVPSRRDAGFLEVALAKHIADKTNWRKLLTGDAPQTDLLNLKHELTQKVPDEFKKFLSANEEIYRLCYPIEHYPVKINSYNFDKNPEISDILIGIKGQYLLFENGVINIRKYQGYEVEFF